MDPPSKRRRLAPKLPDPPAAVPPAPSAQSAQPAPEELQAHATSANAPIPPAPDASPSATAAPSAPTASSERQDFETFAKHLQDAAMYIYRQGQKLPYAHVSALLLKWDDDVAATAEVSSLERVLRDRYNFHTERWGIPAVANPSAKLSVKIANFLNQASANHLLIIYYIGYGYNGPDNQLYWACNAREDSPKLKWDGVRCLFEDAQSDILILLDSCAPNETPIAGSHGAKQAIAACTPETSSREPSGRTFTSYLVDALNKLGNGRPFNAQHLYDEIVATQQQHERQYLSRVATNGVNKPATHGSHTPLFLTLTPGKGQTLDLAPMPRNHLPPSQNGNGHGAKSNGGPVNHDAPIISPAAVADMVFDEARVLVCTTFVGDAGPDMACFNQWITNTPALASKVAVEGMFLGPPTVLLISIPQSLWSIIQHDKICFSLGYINSRNLIHLYDGLMKVAMNSPASTPQLGMYASAKDVEDGRTLLEAREAATNNRSPTHGSAYQSPPYHHRQQQQPYYPPQQQNQPQPSLQSSAETQPGLPLPTPHQPHSQHHPSLYRETGSSSHYEPSAVQRHNSLSQLQHHHHQPLTSPPRPPPLPRIVSRANSPSVVKDETEDSAEMKEAAEQLKALSRPVNGSNGNRSPPLAMISSHLSQIAQDAIKCQADDSTSEDTEMKAADENVLPTKKARSKKDYRFKHPRSHDGQPNVARGRTLSDLPPSQSLPNLLPQGSKQEVQCEWCSHEPFKDSSSLRKHIASAHTRPFPCAFAFAGCTSTFGSKNEWKRHIASQHLCLQYYRCSDCSQTAIDGKGNEFNRKDLFTQHLRRMHAPFYIRKATQKRDSKVETDWEDYVKEMQRTCCIVRRNPPQRSACPKPGCNRLFEGRSAWDEWTEHVGRHMENGEGESLGVDDLLVSWALNEGIIMRTEDGSYRLCNPMGGGSGNGGSNGSGSANNGRHARNGPDDHSKNRSPPVITVPPIRADAKPSITAQQSGKHVLPPTPPPTTTRHPDDEHENAPDTPQEPDSIVVASEERKDDHDENATMDGDMKAVGNRQEVVEANKRDNKITVGGGQHEGEKSTEKSVDHKHEEQPEAPKVSEPDGDDMSGLKSITVAAIAAAAEAIQRQEESTASSTAMEVDG